MNTRRFYLTGDATERVFNVGLSGPLTAQQQEQLSWLLAGPHKMEELTTEPRLVGAISEIGPRIQIETPGSSNITQICADIGLPVFRLEESRRFVTAAGVESFDPLTESFYPDPITTFETGITPDEVRTVPVHSQGIEAINIANKELGLGWDEWDISFVFDLVTNILRRDPTDVELFQLAQMNSEHCRHWFFKGRFVHNGEERKHTLLELIQAPLALRKKSGTSNSVIAFADNSSAIQGYEDFAFVAVNPGKPSLYKLVRKRRHIVFTQETHNHPTLICPFPGAATGIGGCIRDLQATGRGGFASWAVPGYCVGNLLLPGFQIYGEEQAVYTKRFASALRVLIEGSNGIARYGNEFGIPAIVGFCRSFGLRVNGQRREYVKPVLSCGIGGFIDDEQVTKVTPAPGMLVVALGGPAYPIGVGGGSASSMGGGDNTAELDQASVQRGNAAMERKMDEVIRACAMMGPHNPILSIHDQGAGGECNVATEIVSPQGARIDIGAINLGDKTMSVLKIWCAEAQERNTVLVTEEGYTMLEQICRREGLPIEKLGTVTGDGKITLVDSKNGSTPVDLPLEPVLEHVPQKTFTDSSEESHLPAFEIPVGSSTKELLHAVMRLPSVGSKQFLTRKKDRFVGGLTVQQQCCGPFHLPVADNAVIALSHVSPHGAANAIGEASPKVLVNSESGARMSAAEAITNILWTRIDGGRQSLKSSVNWMWPAKRPGEAIKMYNAAKALGQFLIDFGGLEPDGGKDSLSMVVKIEGEEVKSPGTVVIGAYGPVKDISKRITPDLKLKGGSRIGFIDLGCGKNRLGGSAIAQTFGTIGNECPDIEGSFLAKAMDAIQEMIDHNLLLSGHDRSDGGLLVALSEMAISSNIGLDISLNKEGDVNRFLFNEECGLVIEYESAALDMIKFILRQVGLDKWFYEIGATTQSVRLTIRNDEEIVFDESLTQIRNWWEELSFRLEEEQMNPQLVKEAQTSIHRFEIPSYQVTFNITAPKTSNANRPKVAVVRAEGSNGHREMHAICSLAGLDPYDVTMRDLIQEQTTLSEYQGMIFVGGFSYGDVLGSARGWAALMRFNSKLRDEFAKFYQRKDTFSLGICNGDQFMTLLDLAPGLTNQGEANRQVYMDHNLSGKFESDVVSVLIEDSKSIMLRGMAGSILPVVIAHGEGRFCFTDLSTLDEVEHRKLVALRYTLPNGDPTEHYPFNPNGSPNGIAGLCTQDGRHLAMMPHPERFLRPEVITWLPEDLRNLPASFWLRMFENAREFCEQVS